MAPGRARVSAPAGLGKGMINWSGKVGLGKVLKVAKQVLP